MSNHHGKLGKRRQRSTGFTLIEMVITIVILSIVTGTSLVALTSAFNAMATAQAIAPLSLGGQIVMERILKELRNTQCNQVTRLDNGKALQLIDNNGRTVKFHQINTTTQSIYMTYNNDNVNWLLGANVQADSLRFVVPTCDGAGQPVPQKPGLVTVSFTVFQRFPDNETVTLPFRSSVYVRSS